MTQPGRASIEIVGDVSKLGRQLKRDAQRAVDNIDLDTTELANEIGDGFKKGAEEGVDAFAAAQADIDQLFDKIKAGAQDAAEEVVIHFEEGGARIVRTFRDGREEADRLFDDIGDGARESGDSLRRNLITPLTNGFSRFGDLIGSAGSALAGLVISGTNPAGLITIALWTAALTAAIPVVIGLAGALAQLSGVLTVLPAAIGSLAGVLIVTTIAFQGFGDALSAVIDGDPEKIAEAMEKLAPAARSVVKEFQALLPLFRQVGDSIQQKFFEPLVGQLTIFGKTTLPALRNELDGLAQAVGRAVGHFGDLLNNAGNVDILEGLLASTTVITDKLGASLANVGQALFDALGASLPMLEELGTKLAGALDNFAKWLSGTVEDGSFQQFWEDALDVLGRVWNLVKAVGELLGVLFAGTEEGGKDFIDTLTDLTKRLTEFFKSAEGQEALQDFVEIIGAVGSILGYVINATREFIDIFTELDDAVESVIFFFEDLWDGIVEIWDGIVETTGGAIDSIVAWFEALPDRIAAFVESIPGRVAAFFDMLVDQALNVLALGIAAIIVFFTDLPGQITGALSALWETVTDWFTQIKDGALERLAIVLAWFQELPGRVVEFVQSLPGRIAAIFQQIKDAVVTKFNEVITFVKGLPGKILSALGDFGSLLYNAGKRVIQGLINGISDKIGDLKRKVSEAVSAIRDHLPFSPAKIGPLSGSGSPDIAGARIAAMIAAGLDSGLPLLSGAAGRAAGAVAEAGVTPLSTATPGAPSPVMSPTSVSVEPQPIFLVRIGDEDIEAYVEKIVDQRVQVEVRRLVAGTRGI